MTDCTGGGGGSVVIDHASIPAAAALQPFDDDNELKTEGNRAGAVNHSRRLWILRIYTCRRCRNRTLARDVQTNKYSSGSAHPT